MEELKTCNVCGRSLPLSSFYFRKDRGKYLPRHQCKECHSIKLKEYYKTHKKEHNEVANKYHRRKFAGFSPEVYQQKFDEQGGCCAICGKHVTDVKRQVLCADHNHTTLNPRGLLCPVCNLMIGYAYDDIQILNNAIAYLKKYEVE